jgi:hypothetical protein
MSWTFLMAAATVASAAMQYSSARAQAAYGQAAARVQQVQANEQRELNAIQAAQEENERQRRAQLVASANLATAGAAGYDPWTSGSWLTIAGENERMASEDVSNIRLMGSARDRQLQLQGYGAEISRSAYAHQGSTAWLQAGATLLRGGAEVARGWR